MLRKDFPIKLLLIFPLIFPCLADSFAAAKGNLSPMTGVNIPFLIQGYLGMANGSDGTPAYRELSRKMAKKSIVDARNIGARLVRTAASGWGPIFHEQTSEAYALVIWQKDPARFYKALDEVMDDLHDNQLLAVLDLSFSVEAFPALTHDSIKEFYSNPKSESYLLFQKFISEVVPRYKNHPALAIWELHNEMNLGLDLNLEKRCRQERATAIHNEHDYFIFCHPQGNVTTNDAIQYRKRIVSYIRRLDGKHPITSGDSLPRSGAQHLRAQPEFSEKGPAWGPDNYAEFLQNLKEMAEPFDIISVHIYSGDDMTHKGRPYLSSTNSLSTEILPILQAAAKSLGKQLYIGEFFDSTSNTSPPKWASAPFAMAMLDQIQKLNISFSTLWAWEFYQFNPYEFQTEGKLQFQLEPGLSDPLNRRVGEVNKAFHIRLFKASTPDRVPPMVIVTWPIDGMKVSDGRWKKTQFVHVVASDESPGAVTVDFLLNGIKQASSSTPPYHFKLLDSALKPGKNEILIRATDASGNHSITSTHLLQN